MSTKSITFRIDEELKKEGEKLFAELGLNMTTALTAFIRQSIRQRKIPFELSLDVPNKKTLEAFIEAEKLSNNPNTKKYKNVEDLFEDLEN